VEALRATPADRLTNSTKKKPATTVTDTSIIRPDKLHPPETTRGDDHFLPPRRDSDADALAGPSPVEA